MHIAGFSKGSSECLRRFFENFFFFLLSSLLFRIPLYNFHPLQPHRILILVSSTQKTNLLCLGYLSLFHISKCASRQKTTAQSDLFHLFLFSQDSQPHMHVAVFDDICFIYFTLFSRISLFSLILSHSETKFNNLFWLNFSLT